MNGGSFLLAVEPPKLSLAGRKTISARVKLSSGTAQTKLFIQAGSGWTWVDSGETAVDSEGYTTLTLSLEAAAADSGADLSIIKSLGIQLQGITGDGKAELYLHDVSLDLEDVVVE